MCSRAIRVSRGGVRLNRDRGAVRARASVARARWRFISDTRAGLRRALAFLFRAGADPNGRKFLATIPVKRAIDEPRAPDVDDDIRVGVVAPGVDRRYPPRAAMALRQALARVATSLGAATSSGASSVWGTFASRAFTTSSIAEATKPALSGWATWKRAQTSARARRGRSAGTRAC